MLLCCELSFLLSYPQHMVAVWWTVLKLCNCECDDELSKSDFSQWCFYMNINWKRHIRTFTIMSSRRIYNRIPPETRLWIIKAFEDGEDWRTAAKLNGVTCKTVYKWLHGDKIKYNKESWGGNKKKILNETEIDELIDWISLEPTVTLNVLRMRVYAEFGKNVSTTTIGSVT